MQNNQKNNIQIQSLNLTNKKTVAATELTWAEDTISQQLQEKGQQLLNQKFHIDQETLFMCDVLFADNTITIQIAAFDTNDQLRIAYLGCYNRSDHKYFTAAHNKVQSSVGDILTPNTRDSAKNHARSNEELYNSTLQASIQAMVIGSPQTRHSRHNFNQSKNKISDFMLNKLHESLEFFQKYVISYNARYAYWGFALASLCFSTVSAENFTRDVAVGLAAVAGILSSVAKIIHTAVTDEEFRNKESSEIALRIGGLVLLNLTMTLSAAFLSHALFIGLGSSALSAASGALICTLIAGVAANHIYDKHIEDVIPVVKDFLSSSQSYRI